MPLCQGFVASRCLHRGEMKKRPPPVPPKENSLTRSENNNKSHNYTASDSPSSSPRNSHSESAPRRRSRSETGHQTVIPSGLLLRIGSLPTTGVSIDGHSGHETKTRQANTEGEDESETTEPEPQHAEIDSEFEEGLLARQMALEKEWEQEVLELERKLAEQPSFVASSSSSSSNTFSTRLYYPASVQSSQKRRKPPKPSSPPPGTVVSEVKTALSRTLSAHLPGRTRTTRFS